MICTAWEVEASVLSARGREALVSFCRSALSCAVPDASELSRTPENLFEKSLRRDQLRNVAGIARQALSLSAGAINT